MNNFDFDNFDYNDFNVANQDTGGLFDEGADFEDEFNQQFDYMGVMA